MVNKARQRKKLKASTATHHTLLFPEQTSFMSSSFVNIVQRYKVLFFVLAGFLFFALYSISPKSSLPDHIQYWRDSSYTMNYKGFNIFYQDIYRVKNVKLRQLQTEPVLLILNGYPGSSFDWWKALPYLQQIFPRIVIPDFLGTGFSDKPLDRTFSLLDQAAMVKQLITFLNLSEVHVLTHLYGEKIFSVLLDKEDQLNFSVKSVCLTNGGLMPKPVFLYIPVFSNYFNWFIYKYSNLFGGLLTMTDLYNQFLVITHNNGHRAIINMFIAMDSSKSDAYILKKLINSSFPSCFIYGTAAPMVRSYLDGMDFKSKKIRLINRVGHFPQLENPKLYVEEYRQFLKNIL